MEASDEIFRQIRLRNLSGMILIDFINDDPKGNKELTEHIEKLCAADNDSCRYIDTTGLGIV